MALRGFAKGFLVGAGLSGISTLLLAPRLGAVTRRSMMEKRNLLKDQTAAKVAEYRDRGRHAVDKARETQEATKEGLRDAGRILVESGSNARSG